MAEGKLIDADLAASRFTKVLGQLRSLIEKAELTVAPKANPDNPPKALKAFREFRDDLFRRISEVNPNVRDGSPDIGDDSTIGLSVTPPPNADHFSKLRDDEEIPTSGSDISLEDLTGDSLDEMEGEENE